MMFLWFGVFLLVLGCASFAVDRRAAHVFHDGIDHAWTTRVHRTTDWAKGGLWLVVSCAVFLATFAWQWLFGPNPAVQHAQTAALAFLVSLAIGSAILHVMKIVLGRRRPRDELELDLYGFLPFGFSLQYDSFPSGHALTIFSVAAIACCIVPGLALLWFAIALYLALTRALLTAHFLSDVFIGAGIGLLVSREVVLNLFPNLAQAWF
jgi:membrane-associated phospholipid phosphatase